MTEKQNKLIRQRYSDDCGIASLAMLYKTSYAKMRKTILGLASLSGEPFDGTPNHLAQCAGLLVGQGLRVEEVKYQPGVSLRKRYKGRPAVFILPAKGYKRGTEYHAVYWDGKHIYDPNGEVGYHSNGKHVFKRLEEVWLPM